MGPEIGWGGTSGDLLSGSKIASQVDVVSDIAPACWLYGSLWLGEGLEKGQRPLLAKMPHTPVALCVTGAFQAAVPVLELRGRSLTR